MAFYEKPVLKDTRLDTGLMGWYSKVACTVLDDWLGCSKGCATLWSTSIMRSPSQKPQAAIQMPTQAQKTWRNEGKAVIKTQ